EFVEKYRSAVIKRDVAKLVSLAAEDYYDDMGTPQDDDDVDLEGLEERLKATFSPDLLSGHYDIRYRDADFLHTKILEASTYISGFRINTNDGSRWERRLDDNRMILVFKQKTAYEIASGM